MVPIALTIAGSDSSGGAGIQADLKTFAAFGVYGASVLTALTAQNTSGVSAIAEVAADFVAAQIDAVLDDFEVGAAKTGMLARAAVIEAVAERLSARSLRHLVVDPVMVATSGDVLLEPHAVDAMRTRLLPLASLVTPNLREAEELTGRKVATIAEMRDAARALVDLGARAALIKGGHLAGDAVDILYENGDFHEFAAPRIVTRSTHGTGCTLSAAITAGLACGRDLKTAVADAKHYVTRAIEAAPGIGHGAGPLNHLVSAPQPDERAQAAMSDRSFSATLREKAAPIWRAELEHPFVRGLGDGTLPIDAFRFYMRQDYLFLIDYSRVFALAAAKARDLPTMGLFASLLHDTLHKEMGLHRDYCARLGIAADELERTEAAPQTCAYTGHLLAVAYAEPLPSILAALLPCAWGYAEIGAELARRGAMREGSLYAEWVAMYSSAEFAAVANALRKLLDDLTAGWPAAELLPLEHHFITSSRHEYLFWEMAWRQATWTV